ncbi:glycoprotein-N-acetylgalactosamine 3-beta-galactosyltransferase 1-like [Scaptodrosophila lebanonensis]|uniref:N-acetylgalactosaminide beta-1,3-galactosyltransferase n=1 Tax=Drosophila lebanonensis TaxID=7225 RepID=A0A6J2TA52_DROLE|nr:glycoprotein-N-acetylgalactosamine 3-beta-galactosyltransferase 1-like [Scaptodrosophila lebanonensis]
MNSHRPVHHILYLSTILLLTIALSYHLYVRRKSGPQTHFVDSGKFVVDELYDQVRVLCLLPYNYEDSRGARYVKRTWGRHCNELLFVSGDVDEELEPYVPLVNNSENWMLVHMGLQYAYDYYRHDFDWLLKVDDHSFVVMENLRHLLHNYSASEPISFGYILQDMADKNAFLYSKPGYVLSKESLRRFTIEARNRSTTNCKLRDIGFMEDTELAKCLRGAKVEIVDSRDRDGCERFTPIATVHHFLDGFKYAPWLQNNSWFRTTERLILGVFLFICCLTINGQRMTCQRWKDRCEVCIRRLNDPSNNMTLFNDKCREKLLLRWEWQNLNRCDLQYVACRANHESLNCREIAYLTRMPRLERNKQRLKHIPRYTAEPF